MTYVGLKKEQKKLDPTIFKCKCYPGWVDRETMVCDRCKRIFNEWTDQFGVRHLSWAKKGIKGFGGGYDC